MSNHTPTPWQYKTAKKSWGDDCLDSGIFAEIDGANRIIAETFGQVGKLLLDGAANAAHIVRCVNNHDALVDALTALVNQCSPIAGNLHNMGTTEGRVEWYEATKSLVKCARAALKQVEEQ